MATGVNLSFELVGMVYPPEVLQSSPRVVRSTFQVPYHSFSSVVPGGTSRNSSSMAWGNIARFGGERGWVSLAKLRPSYSQHCERWVSVLEGYLPATSSIIDHQWSPALHCDQMTPSQRTHFFQMPKTLTQFSTMSPITQRQVIVYAYPSFS